MFDDLFTISMLSETILLLSNKGFVRLVTEKKRSLKDKGRYFGKR